MKGNDLEDILAKFPVYDEKNNLPVLKDHDRNIPKDAP